MNTTKQSIVSALKAEGYNSRLVSVKENNGGLNGSFTITIRHISVDAKKVKSIAKANCEIDRDERGDILSGANTFVSVKYSDTVLEELRAQYIEPVRNAIEKIKEGSKEAIIDERFSIIENGWNSVKVIDHQSNQMLPMNYCYSPNHISEDLYTLTH